MEQATHIAPADGNGEIIGSPVVAPGVIQYPLKQLGLCAGITNAPYKTTTEVYPDSPRATPEQCNTAQTVAVCAAIDYALAHRQLGRESAGVRPGWRIASADDPKSPRPTTVPAFVGTSIG